MSSISFFFLNKYHCQRKYADYLIIGFLLYNQLKTNSEIKYDKHNKKFLLVFIYFFSLYFDSFLYTTYNNDNNLQIGIYLLYYFCISHKRSFRYLTTKWKERFLHFLYSYSPPHFTFIYKYIIIITHLNCNVKYFAC